MSLHLRRRQDVQQWRPDLEYHAQFGAGASLPTFSPSESALCFRRASMNLSHPHISRKPRLSLTIRSMVDEPQLINSSWVRPSARPMTSGDRNWSSTTGAILMVSLMIFSTWIQVIDNESTLEEAPVPRFLSASDTLSSDAQPNSSQPSTNYGSANNLLVGDYPAFTNARILANIPLTLNASGVLPSTAVVLSLIHI